MLQRWECILEEYIQRFRSWPRCNRQSRTYQRHYQRFRGLPRCNRQSWTCQRHFERFFFRKCKSLKWRRSFQRNFTWNHFHNIWGFKAGIFVTIIKVPICVSKEILREITLTTFEASKLAFWDHLSRYLIAFPRKFYVKSLSQYLKLQSWHVQASYYWPKW